MDLGYRPSQNFNVYDHLGPLLAISYDLRLPRAWPRRSYVQMGQLCAIVLSVRMPFCFSIPTIVIGAIRNGAIFYCCAMEFKVVFQQGLSNDDSFYTTTVDTIDPGSRVLCIV